MHEDFIWCWREKTGKQLGYFRFRRGKELEILGKILTLVKSTKVHSSWSTYSITFLTSLGYNVAAMGLKACNTHNSQNCYEQIDQNMQIIR